MCGIAGIVNLHSDAEVDERVLRRMQEVISHRGPDGEGAVVLGNVGLAHRRLAIIDLRNGRQPMANSDGSIWITYNGEVYNFKELRNKLTQYGYEFRTDSDTEVILKLYERYGDDCVDYLRGMFAFAIWDAVRGKLLLARDRLGIKPLYYACVNGRLFFASEIKAILAAGVPSKFNQEVLPEFLSNRFVAGSGTFYSGIHKLLPGRILTWTAETGMRCHRYWELPARVDRSVVTLADHAAIVRRKLEEAVQFHLVSDVPVGLFLSGGIDSSAIAVLMAERVPNPIHSFAVGFSESDCNEFAFARLVAERVGSRHHEVTVTPREFFTALPRLVWHEDEPIAFPSSVALYFVARLAKEHVKVVLTGEGADELFLGYNRYRITAWNQRFALPYQEVVPREWRARVRRGVHQLPQRLRRYAERTFLGVPPGIRHLLYENFAVFPHGLQRELLRDRCLRERNPYEEELACFHSAPGGLLERMSYADMQTYLVELLMKQDQMSMAASIESRVPFLDHEFVEYAAAIPGRFKLRGWKTKAVLREAVRELLPKEILTRRKMGFPVPLHGWLRGPYSQVAERLLLSARSRDRRLFNTTSLLRLMAEHRSGEVNHGDRLWLLMNLEIWQRIFIDGDRPEDVLVSEPPQRRAVCAA